MNLSQEPARLIGYLSSAIGAIIGLAVVLGFDVNPDLEKAIIGVITAWVPLIIFIVEMTRSRVVSPQSAGEAVAIAKTEPAATNVVPDIKVSGYRAAVVENLPATVDERTIKWKPKVSNA